MTKQEEHHGTNTAVQQKKSEREREGEIAGRGGDGALDYHYKAQVETVTKYHKKGHVCVQVERRTLCGGSTIATTGHPVACVL